MPVPLLAAAPFLCGLCGGGLRSTVAPPGIATVRMAAPCPELEGVRPGADREGEMEATRDSEELWATSTFEVYVNEGKGYVAADDAVGRHPAPESWITAYEAAASRYAGAKVRREHAAAARAEAEANLAHALAEVRRQQEVALGLDREAQAAEELAARRRAHATAASLQVDRLEHALQQAAHKHLALGVHAAEGRSAIAMAAAEAEWQDASRTWELRERAATAAVATAEAEMRRAEAHMELAVGGAEEEMSREEAMMLIQNLYQRELGAAAEPEHDTRVLVTVRSSHGQRTHGTHGFSI